MEGDGVFLPNTVDSLLLVEDIVDDENGVGAFNDIGGNAAGAVDDDGCVAFENDAFENADDAGDSLTAFALEKGVGALEDVGAIAAGAGDAIEKGVGAFDDIGGNAADAGDSDAALFAPENGVGAFKDMGGKAAGETEIDDCAVKLDLDAASSGGTVSVDFVTTAGSLV